jgi:glyoxylase-like metal-dependent hydrolase (beta-lactamase superfamily II)
MKIIRLVLGAFQTNTYIVIRGDMAVVIDPAADSGGTSAGKIMSAIEDEGAQLSHILLTHGHFDHTSAAAELKAATGVRIGARICIHEADAPMLGDVDKSFATSFPQLFKACKADMLFKDGDEIEGFTVMHTPGHSPGSVMFIIDDVIFSGDTLFANSVGRIDGWGGSHDAQQESLWQIRAMGTKDYRILPGHGEETTLAQEKAVNFYLS